MRHSSARAGLATILTAVLSLHPLVSAAPLGAAEPGLVGSLPQETLLLVQLSGMDQLLSKVQKSPLARLKDQPELKDMMAAIESEISKGMSEAKEQLGFDPMDLLRSFRGEVVVAVGSVSALAGQLGNALSMGEEPDIQPESIPFIVAADAGDQGPKVAEYMDKFFAFAVKEGAVRETITVGSGKITVLSDSKPAPSKDEGSKDDSSEEDGSETSEEESGSADSPLKLYFGQAGSRYYFGTSRAFLERTMGGSTAVGGSLLDNPLYRETRRMSGDGDVFMYADVKQLTNAVGGALSATFFSMYWQKAEKIIFGKSFNAVAAAYTLEEKGVRAAVVVHNSGATDGILSVFQGPAYAPELPKILPRSTQVYSSSVFNAQKLGSAIEEIFQIAMSFQNPGASLDSMFEENLGVKFGEFIGSFGGKLHYFAQEFSAENPFASMNYLIELKDPAPIRKMIAKVSESQGMDLQPEKYKGSDLFLLPLGPAGQFAIGVNDTMLVLAGSKSLAQGVIDRLGGATEGSMAEDEEAKRIVSSVAPAQVSMLSYSAKDYLSKYFESMAKTLQGTVESMEPEAAGFLGALGALGNVFGASVGYGQWTEKGFRSESMLYYR